MPTGQELIDEVRRTLADVVGAVADALWTPAELLEYLNDAEREACIRKSLIVDSINVISNLSVTTGVGTYDLDPKTLFIKRSQILAAGAIPRTQMYATTRANLDLTDPDWAVTVGAPRNWFVEDSASLKKVTIYPMASEAVTMDMTIVRLPLVDIVVGTPPEINIEFHKDLMSWMLFRAFSKQDSKVNQDAKTVSLTKEKFYLALFEKVFGERSSNA